MPTTKSRGRRALLVVAVLALCGSGLAAAGPWLLARAGIDRTALPWADPCSVSMGEGETAMLTLEEARLATTAVALRARGTDSPDTSGIDQAVLDRLRDGPPDGPGPSLTCRAESTNGLQRQEMADTGLTPRAQDVVEAMEPVFGTQSLGGYAPGGVSTGHGEDSAHYDGRAVDIFYRPVTEDNRREGWLLANWLVAHAEELHAANVIFDDQIWNLRGSRGGWWPYVAPGDSDNEILRHLDHVHIDVQEGG